MRLPLQIVYDKIVLLIKADESFSLTQPEIFKKIGIPQRTGERYMQEFQNLGVIIIYKKRHGKKSVYFFPLLRNQNEEEKVTRHNAERLDMLCRQLVQTKDNQSRHNDQNNSGNEVKHKQLGGLKTSTPYIPVLNNLYIYNSQDGKDLEQPPCPAVQNTNTGRTKNDLPADGRIYRLQDVSKPITTPEKSTENKFPIISRDRNNSVQTVYKTPKFEEFYKRYPIRKGEDGARRAFVKAMSESENPEKEFNDMLKSLTNQIEEVQYFLKTNKNYKEMWAFPKKWLEDKRWKDEPHPEFLKSKQSAANRAKPRELTPAEIEAQEKLDSDIAWERLISLGAKRPNLSAEQLIATGPLSMPRVNQNNQNLRV